MKKGEVTTQQIVLLVILIASFAVILFFILRLNPRITSEKEICHNSVVLKARSANLAGELDCNTQYVCISGGDECGNFNADAKISLNAENKTEIMKAIANQMADCWWMFGEGKLDYKRNDWHGYHCAICSFIKFDGKIQEKFGEIRYSEFYDFLEKEKKDESKTFLLYMYGIFEKAGIEGMNSQLVLDNEKMILNEKYAIITGLNPNWPNEDAIIHPYIVKADEINSKTACNVFDITKA